MERSPEQLSTSTLFYLFATQWLPYEPTSVTVEVPGGRVNLYTAYANLVDAAVWNLVRKDMVRVVTLRPVVTESATFLGGESFCRLEIVDATESVQGAAAGLEERIRGLVRSAETVEDNDLRTLLRRLALRTRGRPWQSIANLPYTELVQAGMVRQRGWMIKRMELTSPERTERARARFAPRREERAEHTRRHPAEHDAVIADGLSAVQWLSDRNPA